ncbi:MAG: HAD family hydrolase [Gaiellales bacterium]
MAQLEAVLFDYGDTLVGFENAEATFVASQRVFLEALPAPRVELEAFHERVTELLRAEYERTAEDFREVDYASVVRAALAERGVDPPDDELRAAIVAQIQAWNPARKLHPAAHEVVDELRSRGLRVGYVSNTFDPPEVLLEVIRDEGMADRADAIVLSSQVGYRKPSPVIYRDALERVGSEGPATLFVGDRVLEDVIGPSREGMATCLATWFRTDGGDHALADAVAGDLPEVLGVVDRLRLGD